MMTTATRTTPRKPKMTKRRFADAAQRWTFVTPAIVLMIALLGYPIAYTLVISFSNLDLATFAPGEWVGFEHYVDAFQDKKFLNSLLVTGIYLVTALPLQMVLGFGIAYLVNADWRGRGIVRALFLVPLAVAPVVAGGIWKLLLDPLWGVTNWFIGLFGVPAVDWLGDPTMAMVTVVIIDTWRWTPFIVLIASAALLSLPNDVIEAADMDGARWYQKLWHVSLPMLTPIIAATFVVRWLGAVKMFDIVLASTRGGPGQATNIVNLYIYEEAFRSLRFSESSAMAIIVLVITMILMVIFLKTTRKLEEKF